MHRASIDYRSAHFPDLIGGVEVWTEVVPMWKWQQSLPCVSPELTAALHPSALTNPFAPPAATIHSIGSRLLGTHSTGCAGGGRRVAVRTCTSQTAELSGMMRCLAYHTVPMATERTVRAALLDPEPPAFDRWCISGELSVAVQAVSVHPL